MFVFGGAIVYSLAASLFEDSSVVVVENGPITEVIESNTKQKIKVNSKVGLMLGHSADLARASVTTKLRAKPSFDPSIKYSAKQVILRGGNFEADRTLPTGTNLIGKLITSIDTREQNQLYKVLLPFGGKSKGGAEIPKNTLLFGKVKYSGKGDKVFLSFSRGVLPSGEEFSIEAQALSSENYSPGLVGKFNGKGGTRLATTLGLTLVSGMTDVLVEKKEVGKNGAVTPTATLKNGLYQGISQASQLEAQRQAAELTAEPEYVTIDSGQDLIVNLTRGFKYE